MEQLADSLLKDFQFLTEGRQEGIQLGVSDYTPTTTTISHSLAGSNQLKPSESKEYNSNTLGPLISNLNFSGQFQEPLLTPDAIKLKNQIHQMESIWHQIKEQLLQPQCSGLHISEKKSSFFEPVNDSTFDYFYNSSGSNKLFK